MGHKETRQAYLADQLTGAEALYQLERWDRVDLVALEAMASWDLIKGLQTELKATRELKGRPHLSNAQEVRLIDAAFENNTLSLLEAHGLLTQTGMLSSVAQAHLATLRHIIDRDAERTEYLEDPDNAPRYCTRCGKKTTAALLSKRGICEKCSALASYMAMKDMQTHDGPYYTRYVEGMLRYLHRMERDLVAERNPETIDPRSADSDDADERDYDPPQEPELVECPNCGVLHYQDESPCPFCSLDEQTD